MLTISPALSASQAIEYHREEFANGRSNYYAEEGAVLGEWHGRLARQFGLNGPVQEKHFERLAQGLHPETGEQLVQHKSAHEYINSRGEKVRTVDHRAGFDMCFSAPKSLSLTALVGGDDRVREAHRESVGVALDELERYTESRIGGNFPTVTTGEWIVAKFEHDTARPVDGYAAPQLHTHCVVFNITRTEDGKTRALQPLEIFRSQQYATAIYRSELASRLQRMGFALDQGRYGQPEIRGYTAEYLDASSPRRRQIVERLDHQGLSGAAAAQRAAHQTRDRKQALSREEVLGQHRQLAVEHGNQPRQVVATAALRVGREIDPEQVLHRAASAVSYAERRNFERTAVADERMIFADALNQSQGFIHLPEIRKAMQDRIVKGDFIEMSSKTAGPVREFTTREMREHEQRNIDLMRAGWGKCADLVGEESRGLAVSRHAHLSKSQRAAVETVLSNQNRVVALEGKAGTGKTTSLAAIYEAAVLDGYKVRGLAPTSRAAKKLAEAGMKTETLQMHLTRGQSKSFGQKHLYIIDESSLTGTRQIREFLERLSDKDRVIFVGDTRQHEAIEAGRPYAQLQEAGMQTVRLSEIVRQKDAGLKSAVEDLAQGNVRSGIGKMQEQGRVHEILDRKQRIETITAMYLDGPEKTLVVSPDNRSRCEINDSIHAALRAVGRVGDEHTIRVLEPRQNMTVVDRQQAVRYAEDDTIRYSRGSEKMGISAGEYARVIGIDHDLNLLTVERASGELFTYDPRRLSGVQVYQKTERAFAQDDRVQVTAPYHELKLANREMGSIKQIEDDGTFRLKMDDGREVGFDVSQHPHLDYGYAVTSYSSQGQTCDRVLVNIDTAQARGKLLNSRLAYVAVSRAEYDAHIYTNDQDSLVMHLSRDVSQRSAIEGQNVKDLDIAKGINDERNKAGQTADLGISSCVQAQTVAQAPQISMEIA
jgi:conjugative relaxase-like TrwC/TraI family protein